MGVTETSLCEPVQCMLQPLRNGLVEHRVELLGATASASALLRDAPGQRGIAATVAFEPRRLYGIELAVDEGVDTLVVPVGCGPVHEVTCGSPSAVASASRPRDRRLVRVPTGISRTAAASW